MDVPVKPVEPVPPLFEVSSQRKAEVVPAVLVVPPPATLYSEVETDALLVPVFASPVVVMYKSNCCDWPALMARSSA